MGLIPTSEARLLPQPEQSAWRDFSQEEQRVARDLLRKMRDWPGKRFEVRSTRNGMIEVSEVQRRVVIETYR